MSVFEVEKKLEAARPILLLIDQISNTIPKSTYVVYFRNYSQTAHLAYKNISQLKEVLLPRNEIEFKIINFQQQTQPIYIKSHNFVLENGSVMIAAKFESWQLKLRGTVVNQSREGEGMIDMSINSKKGYDQFFNFRKRYKTLQNITKKLEFKIDHRIKLKTKEQSFQFDLQQQNQQHFYLSSGVFEQCVSITLQEITSLQDYVSADILQQIQLDLSQIARNRQGLQLRVKFSNMFELLFVLDFVNNTNFAKTDFIAIRLLETSIKSNYTKIGTESNINLQDCLKLTPLINNTYYDYQWGYLNQNLQKIKAKDTIYQHLDKLTPSNQQYASFINQEIIDLKKSTALIFNVQGQLIKVPMIFVLEGVNCICNQNVTVKFFIESMIAYKQSADKDQRSDKKRVFAMSLQGVMNLSKVNKFLSMRGENTFTLKILNQESCYFIPFERRKVNKSQFMKEVKDLMTKQEVTFQHDRKIYCLTHGPNNSDQFYLLQSRAINGFYLIEMTSSSSLSYQLAIGKEIIFQGSLFKHRIVSNRGQNMVQMLSSLQGSIKIALTLKFDQIQQVNESAATLYQFRHRLQFAEAVESLDVSYEVSIQFDKDSKLGNLRTKISPELKRQTSDQGFIFKQFANNSKALVKEGSLMFTLKIRKMFYNQQLNYFDNELLQSKIIAINPSFEMIKKAKPLNVQSECYSTFQMDVYDKNIHKRMIYHLQIYALKNQFLDHKDSSYKIKIPRLLWEMNNSSSHTKSDHFKLTALLNRRRKNADIVQFKNNDQKEFILDHYNYKDALTLTIDNNIAYSKVVNAIKVRCDVHGDDISWSPQSEWYFAVLNTEVSNFYFLLQRKFDPYEQKKGSQSDRSRKTVSRELSARSDKHKVDPLAKTINNLDLFKLKKKKNDLVAEGRQLTARYVKKQEKIIALTRRLEEIQVEMVKRSKYQETKKTESKKVSKYNIKKKELYRSICECGQRNPKYKGYCENCLKKLKERYEAYFKEYKEKSYLYETIMFEEFNQKQKIERLKRKINAVSNQDIVVVDTDNTANADYFIKGLEQKNIKQEIQNLKVELFQMEEERVSLVQNSNWQMKIMQQKITQQDQQIYKNSQQYNNLKNRLDELSQLRVKQSR